MLLGHLVTCVMQQKATLCNFLALTYYTHSLEKRVWIISEFVQRVSLFCRYAKRCTEARGECDIASYAVDPNNLARWCAMCDNLPGRIARISREIYDVDLKAAGINTAAVVHARTLRRVIKAVNCYCLLGQVQMIDVMRRSLCVRETRDWIRPSSETVSPSTSRVFDPVVERNTSRRVWNSVKSFVAIMTRFPSMNSKLNSKRIATLVQPWTVNNFMISPWNVSANVS